MMIVDIYLCEYADPRFILVWHGNGLFYGQTSVTIHFTYLQLSHLSMERWRGGHNPKLPDSEFRLLIYMQLAKTSSQS